MSRFAIVILLSLTAATTLVACGGKAPMLSSGIDRPSPKFAATSYLNDGDTSRIVVDVRAARLSGPGAFLPLILAFENKTETFWTLDRENLILELPDRTTLPLASYREVDEDYRRIRPDIRIAEPFINTLNTVFPQPPFRWIQLDFYPEKTTGIFPREDVEVRRGQLAVGYLYFRLPADSAQDGRYKLILTPSGADERFVIDFSPYKESR